VAILIGGGMVATIDDGGCVGATTRDSMTAATKDGDGDGVVEDGNDATNLTSPDDPSASF